LLLEQHVMHPCESTLHRCAFRSARGGDRKSVIAQGIVNKSEAERIAVPFLHASQYTLKSPAHRALEVRKLNDLDRRDYKAVALSA